MLIGRGIVTVPGGANNGAAETWEKKSEKTILHDSRVGGVRARNSRRSRSRRVSRLNRLFSTLSSFPLKTSHLLLSPNHAAPLLLSLSLFHSFSLSTTSLSLSYTRTQAHTRSSSLSPSFSPSIGGSASVRLARFVSSTPFVPSRSCWSVLVGVGRSRHGSAILSHDSAALRN